MHSPRSKEIETFNTSSINHPYPEEVE